MHTVVQCTAASSYAQCMWDIVEGSVKCAAVRHCKYRVQCTAAFFISAQCMWDIVEKAVKAPLKGWLWAAGDERAWEAKEGACGGGKV